MAGNRETFFSLKELPRYLLRHRIKALLTFFVVFSGTITALIIWPRSFDSEAKLLVRLGRESVALDPTATTGPTMPVSESRENEINSILEVLQSRGVREMVVDRLGPAVILGAEPAQAPRDDDKPSPVGIAKRAVNASLDRVRGVLEPTGTIDDREKAVMALQSIYVDRPKKSNIISIAYQAKSPELAQTVVAAMVDVYRDEHVRLNRTPRSYEFFQSQEAIFAKQVDDKAEEIRRAKDAMQLASFDGKRLLLETQIAETTTRLRHAEAELEALQARVDSLQEIVDRLPERVTSEEVSGHPNVAVDNMRDRLFALELEEKEMLAKYQPEHPRVIAIHQQVEESRKIVAELPPERTQTTSKINPAREAQELKLMEARTEQSALLAEISELRSRQSSEMKDLLLLNDHEIQLKSLQREFDIAEANYRSYHEKLEQARITQAMDADNISNVTVAQPATFVARPSSPRKREVLTMGFLFAMLSAVGVVALFEALNRRLRTAEQVQHHLGLPVLIHLPRLQSLPRVRPRARSVSR